MLTTHQFGTPTMIMVVCYYCTLLACLHTKEIFTPHVVQGEGWILTTPVCRSPSNTILFWFPLLYVKNT